MVGVGFGMLGNPIRTFNGSSVQGLGMSFWTWDRGLGFTGYSS